MKRKTLKKILREIGLVLYMAVGTTLVLMIASSPYWWDLPDGQTASIAVGLALVFTVIYGMASLHDDYKLVVRVERRRK